MASLKLEDGTVLTQPQDIARELAPLNIELHYWSMGENPQLLALLAQPQLTEADKETVLQHLDPYFYELQARDGYQSRDLIVLHPEIPQLDEMLAKFNRCHTHGDDEVRYIIDGEGIFGFVRSDGSQIELTVTVAEYINIPAGTEHWFYLSPDRRIKAIRYFIDTMGWVPEYTNTPIRFRQSATLV
ncbi:MAG: acireductone dioxygenase [Hydrococcus sp. SU_1_0]|nr:acireductone dioxygenase [Hydrococcus sp. SU_1_0]